MKIIKLSNFQQLTDSICTGENEKDSKNKI